MPLSSKCTFTFSPSLDKGRMWWYNILGNNKGSILHLLRLDPITARSILLTVKLVVQKRGNYDPIFTLKRTEWSKIIIDYFGLSIEAEPSRVGKENVHFFRRGYIPRPSFVKLNIRKHLTKKSLIRNHEIYVCANLPKKFWWDYSTYIFCLERPTAS